MIVDARVLVTGATGSFGRCLARELVDRGCELVLLVRGRSESDAESRARSALGDFDRRRVVVLQADVAEPGLGLRASTRRRLQASVDVVVHAAATTCFSLPLDEARRINVGGTGNVLGFARGAPRLSHVACVSTAFVAGRRLGRVLESELQHDAGWLNTYQQSKYEAEVLVRRYEDVLPLLVLRPSIVLDEPAPGRHQRRSAFRFAIDLIRRGLLPVLPGGPETRVDLVTEADASEAIADLLSAPDACGTYHVAGGDLAPTLHGVVAPICAMRYADEERFRWELKRLAHENPRLAGVYAELSTFICELARPKVFDTRRLDAALGRPVHSRDPLAALHDLGSGALAAGATG